MLLNQYYASATSEAQSYWHTWTLSSTAQLDFTPFSSSFCSQAHIVIEGDGEQLSTCEASRSCEIIPFLIPPIQAVNKHTITTAVEIKMNPRAGNIKSGHT